MNNPKNKRRVGWRFFKCDCGWTWHAPTRDCFSLSTETCYFCKENIQPINHQVDINKTLKTDKFGNLIGIEERHESDILLSIIEENKMNVYAVSENKWCADTEIKDKKNNIIKLKSIKNNLKETIFDLYTKICQSK